MTRRVVEKLCAKKVCVDLLAPITSLFKEVRVFKGGGRYFEFPCGAGAAPGTRKPGQSAHAASTHGGPSLIDSVVGDPVRQDNDKT